MRVSSDLLARRSPEDSLVADSAREAVGVVALEQELRDAPGDAERVAERGERDRLEREERFAAAVVELHRDREAVADAMKLPGRLEVRRELRVLDAGETAFGELALQPCGRLGAVTERRGRAGCERLPVAALGVKERQDYRRPRLVREQLGKRNSWVEWIRLGSGLQPLADDRPYAFQPRGAIRPLPGLLDGGKPARQFGRGEEP